MRPWGLAPAALGPGRADRRQSGRRRRAGFGGKCGGPCSGGPGRRLEPRSPPAGRVRWKVFGQRQPDVRLDQKMDTTLAPRPAPPRPSARRRPRAASPRPPSARHQPGLLRGAPPPRRLARRPAARRTPPLAAYPRRAPRPGPSAGVERVTAHSGRVGLASELTSRGASTTDVMLAGTGRRAGWWRTTRPGRPPNAGPWRGTSEQSGELSVMGQPLRNGYKPPSSSRASATSTSTSSTRSTPFPRPPPSPRTPNTGSWARRPPRRRYRQSHQIGLACRGTHRRTRLQPRR